MLSSGTKQNLQKFIRATNYLSVAQIFLKDNLLLKRPLIPSDLKPRLLGHWGTCPGTNVLYAHLSLLNKERGFKNNIFLLGTGHGFPALQSNLFLEGALKNVDEKATLDLSGIEYVTKNFSWPYGFPSHASPHSPGVILEGGELGYSLSTAYGAVLDNPDMLAACLIGDGEAETATLATSWQLNKLVSQPENGVVLPILHLNGYKISGPTFFGRMSDKEIMDYFRGLRYEPFIVNYEGENQDELLNEVLNQIYDKIEAIKNGAADDNRLPVLIFKSPKGMTGVDKIHDKKITGNFAAHQVTLEEVKTDAYQLAKLEQWLKNYKFDELFDGNKFGDFIEDILPETEARFGNNKIAVGKVQKELILPKLSDLSEDVLEIGEMKSLSLHKVGEYLKQVFELNKENKDFRFFSPDETTSNKLMAILDSTNRAWNMKNEEWDYKMSKDGRSMEMLSEQALQGMMQGYTLSGRHAVMTSYEAFMSVAASMITQHGKFLEQAKNSSFRKRVPSINYLLTSNGWRQDHNGFSHQAPTFIDEVLLRQGDTSNVIFPSCDNASLVAIDKVLQTKQSINAIVAGKTQEPRWRSLLQSKSDINDGISIWDFASDENPEVILAAAGDYMAKETLFAQQILKQELPNLRIRTVYISALSSGSFGLSHNKVSQQFFDKIFTSDKPVILNFHGYPETIKAILFNYKGNNRFTVEGYIEKGSTTTPFDMMARNHTSRWNLVIDVVAKLAELEKIDLHLADEIINKYQMKLVENTEFIKENGFDLPEITEAKFTF